VRSACYGGIVGDLALVMLGVSILSEHMTSG
jgi:hypothetical protein